MDGKDDKDIKTFEKYIFTHIVPIYPTVKDDAVLHIVLKVDNESKRMGRKLLVNLKLCEFVIYAKEPNTTSVLQDMDQICGPFNSQFFLNLADVADSRFK